MKTIIIITEDEIIKQMQEFLTECDADTLAKLTGKIFGGKCKYLPDNERKYSFLPNKNYMGAFGEYNGNH